MSMGGYPTDATYTTRALEQPAPVQLVYGTVIDMRYPVSVEAANCATGARPFYRPRGSGGLIIPFGLICQALLNPNVPAVEYPVLLDGGGIISPVSPYTYPPQQPLHQTVL